MITAAFAATEGAAKAGGGFPPFDATWASSTLFWLAIFFGALYWLMSRRGLPQVASILEERASRIAGDLSLAAAAQKQAEEAARAYDEAFTKARGEAQAIAGKARDEANASVETRRRAVEADLLTRLAESEATIEAGKREAMTNVSAIAAEAAGLIVAHVSGVTPSADEIDRALASGSHPRATALS